MLYIELPVTVDYHQGKHVTRYTVFMYKAVQMLDPVRDSKLSSVLDRYRTLHNRPKKQSQYHGVKLMALIHPCTYPTMQTISTSFSKVFRTFDANA